MSNSAPTERPVINGLAGGTPVRRQSRGSLLLEHLRGGNPGSGHLLYNRRAVVSAPADAASPAIPGMGRRLVWDSRIALGILDFGFIGGLLGAFLYASDGRMDFSVSHEALFIFTAGIIANLTLVYASGGYRRDSLLDRQFTASRLPVALGLASITLFLALHYGLATAYPDDTVYRSVGRSAIIALITAGIALGATLSSRIVFYAMVQRGCFRRRVLVVGAGTRAQQLHEVLTQSSHRLASELIFIPGSVIGGSPENLVAQTSGSAIALAHEPLETIANRMSIDEVVVALDNLQGPPLEHLLSCKVRGIRVTDVQSFIERQTGRVDLSALQSTWLLCSDSFGMGRVDLGLKRLLDIAFSLVLLLVALPVLLVAMSALAIEGHGRVLFKQKRVTRNGHTFWLYKLRTMFVDAEKKGPKWADADDPRITPVGRVLRNTRIDEIPQLINVLRGDMSLVGPRPERPVFVEQLSREIPLYDLRHTVKAGLTGWAQINYRYGASTADARRKLEFDLHYVKNYHFLLDISIIIQTFRVLLWGDGVR